ncbi:MAG: DUF5684 domain-containing protein [Acidibacillus sp.]|uniref:DUF805 domain-containing protein n=1 Tax=Sulfoacidibacillus ferrooxidans TaxID=2005001 RepID=A0A9X1V8Z7_9BACL|nr:DUF5684 domain-containing protein [Sulfoacidibacillus ferrooxidans]MCI0182263.1 hypothetical protein [Sulfoacidibacillus ferrooxidans]MCY0893923.1 DUF5684 domain-containing protein [Acidibacillus sp.]
MFIEHAYYQSAVPSTVYVLLYLYTSTVSFILFRKAQVELAWFAYIPFLSLIPLLWTIGKSGWNILWTFIPIVNIIFYLLWTSRFLRVFGMNPWVLLLFFIPTIGPLIFLVILSVMAFSPAYYYSSQRITWTSSYRR